MSKNKKNKRRVLAVSCIFAALIVAGSTFAWFTSKDEVVNKLSAQSSYDVVAVEDFTPPSNWTPGQEVEKKVGVTNTGNVDAFVKATLTGNIVLKNYVDSESFKPANVSNYVELATEDTKISLPDTTGRSKDEVKAIQAGGRLVYSPVIDDYDYDTNNIQDDGAEVLKTQNGTLVGTGYTPETTGYYIFARSTEESDTDGKTTKVTYDGYYFVKDDTNGDKYYAIDITTPDADNIYKVKAQVKKTETKLIEAKDLNYVANADSSVVYAYYDPKGSKLTWDRTNNKLSGLNGDEIIVDIAVNTEKVATDETKDWTLVTNEANKIVDTTTYKNVESGHNLSFYYNKLLGGGTTASEVINSITLDSNVNNGAYLSLDYNLKVTVDSAQVVDDRAVDGTAVTAVNAQEWAVLKASYNALDKTVTWSERS